MTRINWKHLRAGIKAMLDVPGKTDQAFSAVKSRISKDYKIIFDEQESRRLEKEVLSVKKENLTEKEATSSASTTLIRNDDRHREVDDPIHQRVLTGRWHRNDRRFNCGVI